MKCFDPSEGHRDLHRSSREEIILSDTIPFTSYSVSTFIFVDESSTHNKSRKQILPSMPPVLVIKGQLIKILQSLLVSVSLMSADFSSHFGL